MMGRMIGRVDDELVRRLSGRWLRCARLQHACVGADHRLLGLAREELGLAARILVQLAVDLDLIRQRTLTAWRQADRVR